MIWDEPAPYISMRAPDTTGVVPNGTPDNIALASNVGAVRVLTLSCMEGVSNNSSRYLIFGHKYLHVVSTSKVILFLPTFYSLHSFFGLHTCGAISVLYRYNIYIAHLAGINMLACPCTKAFVNYVSSEVVHKIIGKIKLTTHYWKFLLTL